VLVREHEEALRQMSPLILNVDEVGKSDVVMQLDGEVDNAIKDVSKGAVHPPGGLNHPPKLGHIGGHPVRVEMGRTAQDTDHGQGVSWRPAVDQGPIGRLPGDSHLELSQGGQARPLSMEANSKKLRRGHHEDIGDISRVNTEVPQEEGIALLLGQVGSGSLQINEDSMSLQIGNVVERTAAAASPPLELLRTLA
jgi:hypothetical protein